MIRSFNMVFKMNTFHLSIAAGWSLADELLLYVIHGTLHLVGCDDGTDEQRAEMRQRERACLAQFGIEGRYDEDLDNT